MEYGLIGLIIAGLIGLFLLSSENRLLKSSVDRNWNSGRVTDHNTFISLGTDWQACAHIITIWNRNTFPIVLKSSRWWGDSNTFIENLKEITLQPNQTTIQSFGWAGLGAKEYRIYFEKQDGTMLTTSDSSGISINGEKRLACTEVWETSLGLLD